MGAAGSIQAQAQSNPESFPEKLDEAQCKAYCVEESDWDPEKFKAKAVDGFVTREVFLAEIAKSKNFYDEEKIKNRLAPLEGKFSSPEYYATLPAKFKKVAERHPQMVQPDDWKGAMVKQILEDLEVTSLTKTLTDQEMMNDDGDILLGTMDKESLWEIFDASEEESPDDVRAFVECHTLLASNAKNASQSV